MQNPVDHSKDFEFYPKYNEQFSDGKPTEAEK